MENECPICHNLTHEDVTELDTLRKELAEVTKERDKAQTELAKLHDILRDMPCDIDEILEEDNGKH